MKNDHFLIFLVIWVIFPKFLGNSQIQNGNYQEINFLIGRLPVGNLWKINQNQKTSWDCNSCSIYSIYMK